MSSARGEGAEPSWADDAKPPPPAPKVAVAAVIFDAQGRVLLIERGRPPGAGLWTVPGGRLELGETLAAAVQREVAEETGLAVEVGPLITVVERMAAGEGGYHYVILDYLAWWRSGQPRAGSDARQLRFCALDELGELPLTDGLLSVLLAARAIAQAAS